MGVAGRVLVTALVTDLNRRLRLFLEFEFCVEQHVPPFG